SKGGSEMNSDKPLMNRRVIRSLLELMFEFHNINDVINYFEDEDIELKKVEDSISLHNTGEDEVINTIIKELNLYNRSVISKIIDIMNVFVIKNSNEGLFDFNKQPKPSFNKLIDLMKMDNYGFSKSDCK